MKGSIMNAIKNAINKLSRRQDQAKENFKTRVFRKTADKVSEVLIREIKTTLEAEGYDVEINIQMHIKEH